jgi:hypothetical protein
MHAVIKVAVGAAFAKTTPYKPPGHYTKAKEVAAEKRKAAAAAATTTAKTTKLNDGTKPPTIPPRRFCLLPVIQVHASPRAAKMPGVGAHWIE